MDSVTSLITFVAVAEERGFSAAARRLGLSKATVSKHVASLEDRLGVRLLNRTTRTVSLTDAGATYYERCAGILAELEEADLAVSQMQEAPRGTLRVNGPVSFGHLHLATAIAGYLERWPEVQVDLDLNDRFVDVVDEGYDVVIRVARLPDSSLVARRLAPSQRVLVASKGYLTNHGTPRSPPQLREHLCLRYTYQATGDDTWKLESPRRSATVRVSGPLRVNNGDVARKAALGGAGIALLPTFIVGDDLRRNRLQRVLPGWSDPSASVYAVYPHKRHLAAKVRTFIEHLTGSFGSPPSWDSGVG